MGLSDTYGFLCPSRISYMPNESPESRARYIADAMVAGSANRLSDRLFFWPYNTGYVLIYMLWINLVFISTYYKFPPYDLFSCIRAIGHCLLSAHWRILFIGLIRCYIHHVTILWTSSNCEFNIQLYFLLTRSHPFMFFLLIIYLTFKFYLKRTMMMFFANIDNKVRKSAVKWVNIKVNLWLL